MSLAPANRPGHFRRIPTSKFLKVFCLSFFALKPGTSHTCLRHFQASFRQFQISSAIVVAVYGNFRGTCAQIFGGNPNLWCKSFRFMRRLRRFQAACKQFQLMPVWRPFVGNFPTCHAHVRRQAFQATLRALRGRAWVFFMHIRGHLQAFSATIIATGRQFMHLSHNMFRQRKIRELSGTFCGQFGAILRHSSDNISPSGLLCGNS